METVKYKNNFIFSLNSFSKIKKLNLKKFFFRRKSLSIFKENGDLSINKNEINFLNILNKISKSKKKWRTYLFKKQYLKKFQYKKKKIRIQNYIQKNILSKYVVNYYKILKLLNTSLQKLKLTNNIFIHEVTSFEFIKLKVRFLQKYIF